MSLKTPEEQLAEVQSAITALMTGAQSYTLDGRSVTRANLKDLVSYQEMLEKKVNNANGKRPRVASAKFGSAFN